MTEYGRKYKWIEPVHCTRIENELYTNVIFYMEMNEYGRDELRADVFSLYDAKIAKEIKERNYKVEELNIPNFIHGLFTPHYNHNGYILLHKRNTNIGMFTKNPDKLMSELSTLSVRYYNEPMSQQKQYDYFRHLIKMLEKENNKFLNGGTPTSSVDAGNAAMYMVALATKLLGSNNINVVQAVNNVIWNYYKKENATNFNHDIETNSLQ